MAGARLEAAVRDRVRRRFPGSAVVEYYGASELSFVTLRRDGEFVYGPMSLDAV